MSNPDTPPPRTVHDVLRELRVTFSGRTRYEGMPPRDDELLVAEIERLRGQVRSNALRWTPAITNEEIDRVIEGR